MTDDELCGWLRSMLPASGFAPTKNWAPWLGADRIEQLEREKAVVSDLWEQQKQIALDYLADCNKAADHIEAQAAEIERLRVEAKAQFDRGYYDGCTRASLEARGLEIRSKNDD